MIEVHHLSQVSDFLLSKRIKISADNEWLLGCCNYYLDNDPHGSITNLSNFVYEQWLLADLREIGEASLPPDINEFEKTYLGGEYALQVEVALNVTESCYSQRQKIVNVSTVDIPENNKAEMWEPKVNRVLKLTCTDGVQTLYAMEYKHIPSLCEPFIPGFKVLVTGPVECRRGILLLVPSIVQVLGGEAECLIEGNSQESVLNKALCSKANAGVSSKYTKTDVHPKANISGALCKASKNISLNNDTECQISEYQAIQNGFPDDDVDLFLSDELTQENHLHWNEDQCTTVKNSSINSFPDMLFKNQCNHRFDKPDSAISKTKHASDSSNKKERTPIIGIACPIVSVKYPLESRSSPRPNCDNKCVDQTNAVVYPVGNNNTISDSRIDSYVEVSTLLDMMKKQSNLDRVYRCRAYVDKLTCKPRIKNDTWQVRVDITDHTGVLEVSFSNGFLENMFGYSAAEVLSQKERMKLNSSVKERIDQIVKIGAEKILSLHGIFVLKQSSNDNLIEIIDVE